MFYCGGVPRTERLGIKKRTITSLGCGVNQTAEVAKKREEAKRKIILEPSNGRTWLCEKERQRGV